MIPRFNIVLAKGTQVGANQDAFCREINHSRKAVQSESPIVNSSLERNQIVPLRRKRTLSEPHVINRRSKGSYSKGTVVVQPPKPSVILTIEMVRKKGFA